MPTAFRLTRAFPLPAAARKLTATPTTAHRVESWAAAGHGCRALVRIRFDGAPRSVSGTATIAPETAGSRYVLEAEAHVAVPLVGRKLERRLADEISYKIVAELDFLARTAEAEGHRA